jgi:small-conductance mechanosensitive channel
LKDGKHKSRKGPVLAIWVFVAALAFVLDRLAPEFLVLISGLTALQLLGYLAAILATAQVFKLFTEWMLARRNKPTVEAMMVGRLYTLGAVLAVILTLAYGFGKLSAVGTFLTLFGGMLLGWSLQAPVSGFAAWALVSLMRPFRPGDRIQFPNLGLVGDVKDTGVMYTVLNQVGGSIGSEEAVGRYILVPNALLFSQVVINYTVLQEAAFMLDEVVIRITYDSDWRVSEQILLNAATEVTKDVIAATGHKPYVRADLYDYGVYLRLRYQTRVKDRAEIAYEITKRVFHQIQQTPSVDLAIPYVYSSRAGAARKEEGAPQDKEIHNVREIEIDRVHTTPISADPKDIEQLAQSIATNGLLQPIIIAENPSLGLYEILAGHLRFEACRSLGWTKIPAVVREKYAEDEPR